MLPRRLPRFSPYVPEPDDPAVFWFNSERDDIILEVVRRVVEHHGKDRTTLEHSLNEVAFYEASRLETQRDDEAKQRLRFWRSLLRRVARMSDAEKREALRGITERMTRDIAGNFDPRVYRMASTVAPKLLTAVMRPASLPGELASLSSKRLDDLLRVDGEVELLRRLERRGTLVYVPTHSSNLDSLALGYALYREGLSPVVYGAGKNLFTNRIISFFMHNLGAYRVDRRVRSSLYKDTLKHYSCVLIERGYHSLFFPGGTRSRSGMIERRLKLGLAGTAVEAFARNQVYGIKRPVWFVPVTINYALVMEAESLIEDHLRERGKERYITASDEFSRLDRWIAFFRKLTVSESACVIRFSRPLDPFGNVVDDEGRSLGPGGRIVDAGSYVMENGRPTLASRRDAAYTKELGETLLSIYRRDTVIMTEQLVAHVLFRRLVRETPGIDLFGRLRLRGDVCVLRDEVVQDLGRTRDRARELARAGKLLLAEEIQRTEPQALLERALATWNGYHRRTVARMVGQDITLDDPTLLLFYQNRLVDYAEELSADADEPAAREITIMGVHA